nr:MAG TPA: hypothetical protein [Caudoviricetes sp.]
MNETLYYIDFSDRPLLTKEEKDALMQIQLTYKPMERVDFLLDYRAEGKITNDDFEFMTGLPYSYASS